ncbi:Nitroreductase_Fd-NR2 [Hexamita inflata]|uniref:Nitroreductase Fd-NR2 n=1 Tax=Hexamita inflata TaxID=28002 RepID=A0AA86PZC8_9EUKA|nr:Nitroreductase Fd-NR2 [Hexamita inflata]
MSVQIIQDECIQCQMCVAECPSQCLSLQDGQIAFNAKSCISCGHCFAICPKGAITLNSFTAAQAEALSSNSALESKIINRRSIRSFKSDPLPHTVLNELIQLTRFAPSARNTRLTQFVVIGRKTMNQIGEQVAVMIHPKMGAIQKVKDIVFRGAPHVIVAIAPESATEMQKMDGQIAVSELEIALPDEIGSFWCGFLTGAAQKNPEIRKQMNLPEGFTVVASLGVGTKDIQYARPVIRENIPVQWIE